MDIVKLINEHLETKRKLSELCRLEQELRLSIEAYVSKNGTARHDGAMCLTVNNVELVAKNVKVLKPTPNAAAQLGAFKTAQLVKQAEYDSAIIITVDPNKTNEILNKNGLVEEKTTILQEYSSNRLFYNPIEL